MSFSAGPDPGSDVFGGARFKDLEERLARKQADANRVLANGEAQIARIKKLDPKKTRLEFRPPSDEDSVTKLTDEERCELDKLRQEYATSTGRFQKAKVGKAEDCPEAKSST